MRRLPLLFMAASLVAPPWARPCSAAAETGLEDSNEPVAGGPSVPDGTLGPTLRSLAGSLEKQDDASGETVPGNSVEHLNLGPRGSRLSGALIGAGIGALAGAVLFSRACEADRKESTYFVPGNCAVLGAIELAPVGALLGFLGASGARSPQVRRGRVGVSVRPTPGRGGRAEVSIDF